MSKQYPIVKMALQRMQQLDLREYERGGPFKLSVNERDILKESLPSLTIEPALGENGIYQITPSSVVGALAIGDLSILIRPKIGIPKLLSLACYALGALKPHEKRQFDFEEDVETLPDTLAIALASAARTAFAHGLLHGYRTEEEALLTVRGRIRFEDQLRRRYGMPIPVEVRYDEFTDDIMENRLVKAAIARLGEMSIRSSRARRGLAWTAAMLENVTHVSIDPTDVPEVTIDRLNEHYRGVVGLSRLILQNCAFEANRGSVRAIGFVMNMNVLFQEFLTVALREELRLSDRVFCSDDQLKGQRRIYLDDKRSVKLEPDLTWWDGRECVFVGDAKYKVADGGSRNADLYQLLAYTSALDLPGGMLIYAQGEAEPVNHEVRHIRKQLEIVALDLSGSLDDILDRVKDVAGRVRAMCEAAQRHHATN